MLLTHGVFFVDGALRADVSVRCEGGAIRQVGALSPLPGEDVLDAGGAYVLPGFVDIHIHGFAGRDCMEGEDAVRAMSRGLAGQGVAAFVPTTMSAPPDETRAALAGIGAVMNRPEPAGAAVLGAHMEAPFLSPAYSGAQRAECMQRPSPEAYDALTQGLSGYVRMMTLAPEVDGALALIEHLTRQGVVACCAHSGATSAQVHAAADAGLKQITHLFNAQSPLHHREPGVPGAGLSDPRLLVQVIADCIHLHEDALRIAALCKGPDGVALITDAMMAAGMPDGEYTLGGQRVIVRDGAARLERGNLAGSTLTLHAAVRNMIVRCGLSPETVIPMATSTPARSVGAQTYGAIAPGKAARFALMDREWNFLRAL